MTAAQHILIHYLVLFEIISLAVGIQYSLFVSSYNETWNNIHEADGICMSVTYADMVTLGKPPDDKGFGPVWLSSETVFSKWIHLTGCFTAKLIDNKPNKTFTTTENCLKFCRGKFGITYDKCICQESYQLFYELRGCVGWKCSMEDGVPCGNTKKNLGHDCVCSYELENSLDIQQAERIGYNCVAYHSNSSSFKAHRCSDSFLPLCVDASKGIPDPNSTNKHQWTDAGHYCYGKNKQFYSPKKYEHKTSINTSRLFSPIYWVATFRINLTSTNLTSKLFTSLSCPAAVNRNITVRRVLMPCSDHLPTLCRKEQTILTSSTSWYIPVLIPIIAVILLIVFIFTCVVVKRRRRKRATKEKAKVILPEIRNPSSPTCSHGNDGPVRELDRGNSDNDIYNELHEDKQRRPDDKDELYDHAPAGNNIYGQLHQRHVTCDESAYDSMAAIRCAEGMYGTTANRSCSVTDEEYGHLAACSAK